MTFCEIAKKDCNEIRKQEDYTLSFDIFTDRAVAHSGAVELCEIGVDSKGGVVIEGQCGLNLYDANIEGAQNV